MSFVGPMNVFEQVRGIGGANASRIQRSPNVLADSDKAD